MKKLVMLRRKSGRLSEPLRVKKDTILGRRR
jgi:hypothetical protein